MAFEEIKPDIFDINRDMPMAPAAPSFPRLERVDSGPVRTRPLVRVLIIYQIGPKFDQKDPTVMF